MDLQKEFGLALIFKDVLISLFLGVFAGAMILFQWNPFTAFARAIDSFIAPSLADPSNASIIIFTTLLGERKTRGLHPRAQGGVRYPARTASHSRGCSVSRESWNDRTRYVVGVSTRARRPGPALATSARVIDIS